MWANTINGGQDVYYTHIDPFAILDLNDVSLNLENVVIYPNPFKNETTISLSISNSKKVSIKVFDILGRKQAILFEGFYSGNQSINWDGTNGKGQKLSNGVYFVEIKSGAIKKVMKVILK